MKIELRHCKSCFCMAKHFIKPDGSSVCGKCKHINKSNLPPGWGKMFGLKEEDAG